MPSRHSKNSGDRSHYTSHEKAKARNGSIKQRLGTDSQLPFGYCSLSMHPAEEPVVSPSGHIYSREFILEYLLTKSQELKKQQKTFEDQQLQLKRNSDQLLITNEARAMEDFIDTHHGVKRKLNNTSSSTTTTSANATATTTNGNSSSNSSSSSSGYFEQRRKYIDDTASSELIANLSQVCPWVPQFTPQAQESIVQAPSKRPSSPFSGQPLRAKDLISIDLIPESSSSSGSSNSSIVKYLCPVSRKTITNQKVYLIKSTGALMIEQVATDLVFPTMTCPLTGKKFKLSDVLELKSAASGFSASGSVEAKVYRPSLN